MHKSESFIILALLFLCNGLVFGQNNLSHLHCSKSLNYFLHFVAEDAPKISLENPISHLLSSDAFFLKYEYIPKLFPLHAEVRRKCTKDALQVYHSLLHFFKERLQLLLSESRLEEFYIEYKRVLAPCTTKEQKEEIFAVFYELEARYLQTTHETLLKELQTTQWKYFELTEDVKLETWPEDLQPEHLHDANATRSNTNLTQYNEEWKNLLKREAPAAVNITNKIVLLRPFEYTPLELKIFLFHELAHLSNSQANPQATNSSGNNQDIFKQEQYAWEQTLLYLDHLEKNKIELPSLFQKIQNNIWLIGLQEWIKLIIFSRE